jgi:hypothetical protein
MKIYCGASVANGTKRTIQPHPRLSAFGPKQTKVDSGRGRFVRF